MVPNTSTWVPVNVNEAVAPAVIVPCVVPSASPDPPPMNQSAEYLIPGSLSSMKRESGILSSWMRRYTQVLGRAI